MLRVDGLSASYGDLTILRDISFQLEAGKVLAILGHNGVGKTTLLRSIMGEIRPQAGVISLQDRAIANLKPHQIARLAVAYIPQDSALFGDLSVRQNLQVAYGSRPDFEVACERVLTPFAFLREHFAQRAGTLSGGEQKMLLVARALLVSPRLILADEVTEGVQPKQIGRIAGILREAKELFGITLVLVEQHIDFALGLADQYLVIKQGQVASAGDTADSAVRQEIERQLSL